MKRIALSVLLVLALVLCVTAMTAPQAQAADDVVLYHCQCGNLQKSSEDAEATWKEATSAHYAGCSQEILTWTQYPLTSSAALEPGNYYLWDNGAVDGICMKSATIVVGTTSISGEFNIDMNGLNFTTNTNGTNYKRAFQVGYNSTLNLCNTKSTGGTVSALGNSASHSGVVLLSNYHATTSASDQTAEMNLYGVSLKREAGLENLTAAGAVRVTGGCTLNAYDCTITGGYVTGNGGAIEAQANSFLNLQNVDVVGGTANNGGAILNSGTMTMTGGTVTGAAVTTDGGAFYNATAGVATVTDVVIVGGTANNGGAVANTGILTIKGGKITGTDVSNVGSAIYSNKTLTVENTEIIGASSGGHGGSVCVGGGSFTMTGGSISGGTTTGTGKSGGNIYVGPNGALTLTDVTVTGGTSASDGGNIFVVNSNTKEIALTDCVISGGTSANNGGNLFLGTVTDETLLATLSGCTLEDGEAVYGGSVYTDRPLTVEDCAFSGGNATYGGALYLSSAVTVTDSSVTGGYSVTRGGNIYLHSDVMATLTNVTVTDGETAGYGGNLFMNDNSTGTLIMTGCTVSDGISAENGGNLWIGAASSTIDSEQEYLVKLHSCVITGGKAKTGGSIVVSRRVAMNSCTVGEKPDGTYAGGVATNRGGNVFINDVELVLNGSSAIVAGNSGESNGGNVYIGGVNGTGKLTMNNTSSLKAGRNTARGGNLYMDSGEARISGSASVAGGGYTGTYANGTPVTTHGGNIYVGANATCTLLGNANVRNGMCTGESQSANISVSGQLNIGGNASVYGGKNANGNRNIQIYSGNMTMSGTAKVDGGVTVQGGTVVLSGKVTLDTYGETTKGRTVYLNSGIVMDVTGLEEGAVVKLYDSAVSTAGRQIASAAASQTDIKSWITLAESNALEGYVITREKDAEGNVTLWLRQSVPVQLRAAEGDVYDYQTLEAAVEAFGTDDLVILNADIADATIASSILLDLAGHDLTNVTVAEGVTLRGMDSATNEYDCSDDYGTITGTVYGTVEKHIKTTIAQTGSIMRYLAVEEDGVISFHRFYLGITKMSLKPGTTGVGYRAVFAGDAMVQAQLAQTETYGFNLWVGESGKVSTFAKDAGDFVSKDEVTLRINNFDVKNYGETAIYGNVFLKLADGTVITSSDYSYTLRSLVEKLAQAVESLTSSQITALQTMLQAHEEATAQWSVDAIRGYAA